MVLNRKLWGKEISTIIYGHPVWPHWKNLVRSSVDIIFKPVIVEHKLNLKIKYVVNILSAAVTDT